MWVLSHSTVRRHWKRVVHRPARLAPPTHGRRAARWDTDRGSALWRVCLYAVAFALLSNASQPRALDALGRQAESIAPITGITARIASCLVLRGLADEFDEQLEPVPPAAQAITDRRVPVDVGDEPIDLPAASERGSKADHAARDAGREMIR